MGLLVAGAVAACTPQPLRGTPSSDQSAFAQEYPARLLDVRTSFAAREQAVRSSFTGIRALPGKLSADSAKAAAEIVRQADAAGRSSYYVEEALSQEGIARFLTEERASVRGRIAGSVAFVAKEKECAKEHADELGSAAASAAERAVQRELEERLHHRNEATRLIELHRARLGERNVPTLEKQADTIAWSSYLAYVRLELYRRELEELVAQEENIKTTLQRARAESQAALDSGKLSRSRRAVLEQRVSALDTAKAAVDRELPPARQEIESVDDKLQALQDEYRELIDGVVRELEQRGAASDEPDAPGGATGANRNRDITGTAR